ncbi:MAG: type II toxin-antitoxin system RelE/ParE family toxin [Pseudanabaena sp. CRU_2_10]|nr:type II toxin-antitoxin system RelE/ParE family toxin [Pseudanabaena sp. CRU_2_10]
MSEWKVEFFKFPNDNSPVLDWFQSQEPKVKAKLARIFDLLEGEGISVGKPYVAPLEDKLYEIRIEQDTNIYRILYFAYTDKRFILLHGFQKKTQKTPKKELDISKERMKAFLANEKDKQPPKNKDQTQKKGKKR